METQTLDLMRPTCSECGRRVSSDVDSVYICTAMVESTFNCGSNALMECGAVGCSYPDVWRRLHPDQASVYTVWDEKTFARSINAVRHQPMASNSRSSFQKWNPMVRVILYWGTHHLRG